MKKKILCFSPIEYDNTAFWRTAPLYYLNSDEYEIINASGIADWNWTTVLLADVLFIHRPCTPDHVNIIQLAKDKGAKVITDFDDNLFAVGMDNPTWQFYQDMRINILKCLRMSDEIWVTTEMIKSVYEKFNKNITVIPNAWNNYLFPEEKKLKFNHDTRYCLWRGGSTHEMDVYENADDLIRVINKNTDWTFNFWGWSFTYLEMRCKNNYLRRGASDTLQYFNALLDYNPNILIFPLVNNEFNRCKSNISWLEITYAGGVLYGNTELSEFSHESIFPIENLDIDLATIKQFPDTLKELEEENEKAWAYIKENLLLSKVNQQRHGQIMKLL
jgi:hypothetical protein